MQRQQTEEIWRIKWMLLRKEGNSSGFGNNGLREAFKKKKTVKRVTSSLKVGR